ncbi:MAG: hypothetical protein DRI98_13230 [Bacteroidetes bacterium]|nr:MAG: hypothetical protein DRI98_13230 [Bacteroidota bacterium]RLE06441.1 MAG: hypothetical protein DRJ13_00145 [Bacteroidota bacterium]
MKFNWGTGILIFLILFLLACGLFIGFAMRQEVSLVHKDYYEKGVDHSQQMNVEARSAQYKNAIGTQLNQGVLQIDIEQALAAKMDSARFHLYRPSDSKYDIQQTFDASQSPLIIPGEELIPGRYILKVYWSSGGLNYEIDQSVFIP